MPKGFRISFRRRRRNNKAPAKVTWGFEESVEGSRRLCVHATCGWSDQVFGPVWGHSDAAVRRALACLTAACDCPAKYHTAREYEGHRVVK